MAYNKKKYISADHVNEISDAFNKEIFLREAFIDKPKDFIDVLNNILIKYDEIKDKMLKSAGNANLNKFESKLFSVINKIKSELEEKSVLNNDELSNFTEEVNESLDAYRRQGDIVLTKAKNDMLDMFRQVALGDRVGYDSPWLRAFQKGEKFLSFSEDNNDSSRYIYKGFVNQAILGYASQISEKLPIVVTKKELEQVITSKFEVDPVSSKSKEDQLKQEFFKNLKGKKSLTSLFTPKISEYYLNKDGSPWRGDKGRKKPSEDEIKRDDIKVRKSTSFISHPVWAVSDLVDSMSEDLKLSFEKLKSLRIPKSIYLEKENAVKLDDIVEKIINEQISQHKIKSFSGGNRACYFPSKDIIQVPDKMQFKNPVERYSVWVHELTHSTKHLLGRKAANRKGSPDYAFEELCAETTAFLMVKDLESKLKEEMGGKIPDDWQDIFTQCYNNKVSYNQSWGHKVGIEDLYNVMVNEIKSNNNFSGEVLMGDVINALKLIQTGKIDGKEITEDLRHNKKLENFKKLGEFDFNKDNDASIKKDELSSEMTM